MSDDRPGTHAAIAAGLDAYHARNLIEALAMVTDTGDWHGSLRIACKMVLDREGDNYPQPNMTVDAMRNAKANIEANAREQTVKEIVAWLDKFGPDWATTAAGVIEREFGKEPG